MANYFCETYLVISNLLCGTSTLASPRVPPMIGFAFLQLACVYLLHTAVTSSTSLVWMHSLACSRHSCSTQSMIATQKGNSWRLNQGGFMGALGYFPPSWVSFRKKSISMLVWDYHTKVCTCLSSQTLL